MDSTAEANAELRTRVRQQEVVAELGQQALETDDLDGLMHDASLAVAETLDNEYAKVLELLPGGDEVFLRQGVGWREGLVGSATVPTDLDSQAGYTLLSEQPIIVDDLRTEERFSGPELLTSHGVVSGISVVIGSVEDPWGVLGTHTTENCEFTDHDANFVQSVANVLATAIENERTRRELEESYGRITDAFYALDDEWAFTHVDDRAEALLDRDSDELLGEDIWEEFEWAADSKLRDEYERAMGTQESATFELYYPEPIERWLEIHAAPSGTGLSVYFRDITDRKQREQQLEQYHALTEAASDVIITIDEESTIRSVNPAVEDVFGYRPDELDGESLTTLMADELADRHRTGLTRYLETGTQTLDWDYIELPGRHADGSEIPLAVSFSETDYEGEHYFTGIVRDITERKERERELELFRSLLDHSNDSVLVIDPETGQFLDANETACQRRGYSRAEFLELNVPDLQTEIPDREVWQSFVADLEDEGQTTFDGEHRRKDGTTYPVEVNAAYVELDREYVLAIARDVTERRERERKLEESERRYRTLAECFPNGIVTLFDDDLRYTLAAGRAFDELPVSPEDLEGKSGRDAWNEDVADTLEPTLQTALGGEEATIELEYAGRDWIVHTVPVTDENETVSTGITMAQDITERKEYRRKLEESERQLSTLMANVPGMVYRCRNERGWPMEFVSDGCRDVTGYEPDALERGDVGWGEDVMLEEDREMLWETVNQEMAGGETFSETYRIKTADGEERWVRDYGRGLFDEDGELTDIEGIISDITARKETQRKLEESERRYRTLAENFPNGAVGVYDHDLRYTLTKGAVLGDRLPGADRVEGERLQDVFPPDTVADLEPLFRSAVEDGETDSVTTEFGDRIWRVWAAPLRDADDEIFAGLSFAQDVTEEVEREHKLENVIEQLEESNERLEQFAYAASHDLQEPLRMVTSYLQLLENRYGDAFDEDGEEFLEFAVDGAERMREMIDGLLAYSRVDTQGDPLEPLELDDVLEHTLENLQVRIDESDADIVAEPLPRVHGDRSQLQQVFQNLLSNAIEYSGDDPPRIHVAAERNGWKWTISVRDEGIGIDPDDEERIFDVFQRLHSHDEHPGTGIGLSLCQRIVERHGGEIWVDSEPGAGTTISFTLPPVQTHEQ